MQSQYQSIENKGAIGNPHGGAHGFEGPIDGLLQVGNVIRQRLGTMDDCQTVDLIRQEAVNDAVAVKKHFPDIRLRILRDDACAMRQNGDFVCFLNETIHESLRVFRRVDCYISVDAIQMLDGSIREMHSHGVSPYRARTSSIGFVRPASLSASPRSIACRT